MADNSEENVNNGLTPDTGDAIDGNTAAGVATSEGGKKKKKGKNKNKAGGEAGASLSADQQDKLRKAMELLNMQTQGGW